MAHFAQLDSSGIVVQVIVVGNQDCIDAKGGESEQLGVEFCRSLFGENTEWIQTSYSGNIRKNYAGPGYAYDRQRDAFIPPKPFESWLLDETSCRWQPPTPMPDDGGEYVWDEASLSWLAVERPSTNPPS